MELTSIILVATLVAPLVHIPLLLMSALPVCRLTVQSAMLLLVRSAYRAHFSSMVRV